MSSSRARTASSTRIFWPLLLAAPAFAGDNFAPTSLFSETSTMTVQITAPLSDVMRARDEEKYHDGIFRYADTAGNFQELDVKLRARGNFRRRKTVCHFAPLRLSFPEQQSNVSIFGGQDQLKLVTHCESTRSVYEQYVLKEYLAYRIFQLLTDLSFRVRLLHVTYTDTSRNNDSLTKYAFLIEGPEHLAERIGKPLSAVGRIHSTELVAAQSNRVAVFEYFIGNTDFSAVLGAANEPCCHNVILFENGDTRYLPVPYDFDLSGLVNARYAAPNPKYHIKAVTDRLYRGLCDNNLLLDQTLQRFRDLDARIRQLIDEQEGLTSASRSRVHRYVDKFYDDVSSEREIERNLRDNCS